MFPLPRLFLGLLVLLLPGWLSAQGNPTPRPGARPGTPPPAAQAPAKPEPVRGFGVGNRIPDGGTDIARPNGQGIVSVRVVEGSLRFYFLDADRLIIKPPFPQGRVTWQRINRQGREDTIPIRPSADGAYLGAERRITPPFLLFIRTIFFDPAVGEAAGETLPRTPLNED